MRGAARSAKRDIWHATGMVYEEMSPGVHTEVCSRVLDEEERAAAAAWAEDSEMRRGAAYEARRALLLMLFLMPINYDVYGDKRYICCSR